MDLQNRQEPENTNHPTIYLTDESGKENAFELLGLIGYQGKEYVALLPAEEEDPEEAGEVVILQIGESPNPDEECYLSVDDDDTLDAVFEIFQERFQDEFHFVDE